MRYPRQHKRIARHRLLESGGRLAKAHGFAGSGMDALAAAAGVTTGSLYKHFSGKSDLFAALIAAELQRTVQMFSGIAPDDADAIAKILAAYLSPQHVRHPERGCALPSLTPEVARGDESVRRVFQSGVREIHAVIERFAASSERAWTLLAQSVGAVMLARAMHDDGVRGELLAAVMNEAQALLDKSKDGRPGR